MTCILEQLNYIRYSKDEFLKEKELNSPILSNRLENIIKIIKNNIKKSGGSNSPFQNSHSHSHSHSHSSYGHKNYKSSSYKDKSSNGNGNSSNSPSKSWRITKTKIISPDLSAIDKNKNEINALLNKLSPKNFTNICKQIQNYYTDESSKEELVNNTIDNVFMKAVMQPVYCPYYVKFLKIVNEKYEKIDVINKKCIEFKQIIKKEDKNSDELSLSEKEKYDLFCKANKEKTYKEGYSQFIGELFNNKMINSNTLKQNISFFVENLEDSTSEDAKSPYVEDLLICICKLFDTVSNMRKNDAAIIKDFCYRVITIKNNENLPKRLKFKLMDLKDLMVKRKVIIV